MTNPTRGRPNPLPAEVALVLLAVFVAGYLIVLGAAGASPFVVVAMAAVAVWALVTVGRNLR